MKKHQSSYQNPIIAHPRKGLHAEEGRRPVSKYEENLPRIAEAPLKRERATQFQKTISASCTGKSTGAFAPFVRPTPQSDAWRHDRGRIVSRAETAATRTRDGRSSFHRLASVGQGHPGIPGSLRFLLRCVRKWTSRSGDRKTARRSRVFRHRSSPHPEGTPRKREKGPHDACGSRDNDKGRPGMGVPTPQFGRCRTGNRR